MVKLLFLIQAFISLTLALECPRQPDIGTARGPKLSGDGGFHLQLSQNVNGYVPGTPYTVSLKSPRNRQFTHFLITAVRNEAKDDDTPNMQGIFQLFGDSLTTFHEECVNTVSEKRLYPKHTVEVIWTAPPTGSGCITLRAMVLENRQRWFADDGQLSLELCEKEEKPSADECCACDLAEYKLVFEGLWSNVTHPKNFPISLWLTHFSDVIGASHEKNFTFWGDGQIATDGFRLLAEWGSVSGLNRELQLKAKHLKSIFIAPGLWYPKVNTNTTARFKVNRKRPMVSLVSMFGPSPDWIVGVNGLDLCLKDCTWKESVTLDLYPWDAGTDSGLSYESPNAETKPRERMYRITTKYPEDPRSPFYDPNTDEMQPLARMFLTRETVQSRSCDESFLTSQIEISENVEEVSRPECGVTDWTEWGPCSVSCGKGLRMRTREYRMPGKAQMFQCSRQLVGKEMCVAEIPECEGGAGVGDVSLEAPDVIEQRPEGICSVTVWSEWSPCSATCGKGLKMRRRHFLDRMGPKKCFDVPVVEKEPCMVNSDCGPPLPSDNECPVTEWTDWSPCTVSCGGNGTTTRTRFLLTSPQKQNYCADKVHLEEVVACGSTPCPSVNPKEICMQSPDEGPCRGRLERWYFEPRKLMCVPFNWGGCRGNKNNFLTADACNNLCQNLQNTLTADLRQPIDCEVSEWSTSSPCSVSCGPGFVTQKRRVLQPAENGGKACPRRLERKRRCRLSNC